MSTAMPNAGPPAFYTVREAAEILRCNPNTLYRAIHDDAFPAIRIRNRFVVPAAAVDQPADRRVGLRLLGQACVLLEGFTAELYQGPEGIDIEREVNALAWAAETELNNCGADRILDRAGSPNVRVLIDGKIAMAH